MMYNPIDQDEFKKQIKELLEIPSIRESNSHAEIVRNKFRMVVNYKQLNNETIFDGCF